MHQKKLKKEKVSFEALTFSLSLVLIFRAPFTKTVAFAVSVD